MLMKKYLAVTLTALVATFSQGAHADKPKQVTIGYIDLVNCVLIAKQLGLPEKALGVPVKWVKFESGVAMNTAIASGSVDFGSVGSPPAAIGVAESLPYKGIYIVDVLGAVESLAARNSAHIAGVKDLVGKKVAVPFGTTSHYELLNALKRAHVGPAQVKTIDMGPPAILAAWKRGDIDAAYVWQPVLGELVKDGGHIVLTSEQMAKAGYVTWDVAVVTKGFAAKYPGLVGRYVHSLSEATDYWLKHPRKSAQLIAKELSAPQAEVVAMMHGTMMTSGREQLGKAYLGTSQAKGAFAASLYSTAEFLHAQKLIAAVPTKKAVDAFIDPSFLEASLK